MKARMKKNNKGFSLVELIVTLLIMSMVMVAAAGFLITAINSSGASNIEIQLQNEAQITKNQINDILIEAKKFSFSSGKLTVQTKDRTYRFYVDLTEHKLMYMTGSVDLELLASDSEFGRPGMLGNYFENFSVSPVYADTTNGMGGSKLITIDLDFAYAGRSYKTTSCVSLRN